MNRACIVVTTVAFQASAVKRMNLCFPVKDETVPIRAIKKAVPLSQDGPIR